MDFKLETLRSEVDTSGNNKDSCSSSLGNDISFSGAILDLLNIRLVIV